ncbi:putative ribonuclease H-like domain-containing protein [Tanacetum coccineum]
MSCFLSPNFKLLDESQVLLKVLRQNNMYSFDIKNVVPSGGLTCLFAKAIIDESNLWHRRLGHVNFKTMNKLVKGNLVRAHIEQILPHPSTYQRHRKTQNRKRTKKDTKLPQTSVPQDLGVDEAVHTEGGDTVERGMDTCGNPRRQDTMGGAPDQTRSESVLKKPNEPPISEGHTSGSGKGRMEHQFELMANVPLTPYDSPLPGGYTPRSDEGRLQLQELMTMCTKLLKQVLDLEKEKDAQDVEILRLMK